MYSYGVQAGKSSTAPDSPPITGDILDDSSAAATRNRFVVVDDRLRGDEELAIAILEKAVLGETVLDKVVLEQLKSYIRGGDQDVSGGGEAADQCPGVLDGIVRDVDSLSVSSSEEGDKFEDACGDVSSQADTVPQLDGLEKLAIAPQRQRTLPTSDMLPMIRTPAEGLDAAAAQAQAKLKDRPITKGNWHIDPSLKVVATLLCGLDGYRLSCQLDISFQSNVVPRCRQYFVEMKTCQSLSAIYLSSQLYVSVVGYMSQ